MPSISTRKSRKLGKRRQTSAPLGRKPAGVKSETFSEWARRVAGMVKGAPRDLSTREGFGR